MERIAIISDIHGNLEALKCVLYDIKNRGITRIFCLGDIIAKGIHQKECLDLIRENCEVVIKGNCDEFFAMDKDLLDMSDINKKRYLWNRTKISDEDREYLYNLPFCYEFYMSGRLVRLIHAHPEEINKFIGNIDKIERYSELLMPSDKTSSNLMADILVYGHSHAQNVQRMYNRVIINAGSVGNPLEVFRNERKDGNVLNTTLANYLILSGNYNSKDIMNSISSELVNIPYDIDKELKDNNSDTNVEASSYEYEIRNGMYRDMEVIKNSFKVRGIDVNKI